MESHGYAHYLHDVIEGKVELFMLEKPITAICDLDPNRHHLITVKELYFLENTKRSFAFCREHSDFVDLTLEDYLARHHIKG